MTTTSDLVETIPGDRIVDNRVYTDPDVFDAEVECVFEHVWLLACHESEVASTGDFVTTELAGTPVIVNRDREGRVRAFCNTCRHRGSLVVADERGTCSAFRCPYHSWLYSLEGELVGIPGEEAYEGSGVRRQDFPLVELACDTFCGLVFVSLADEPEPLRAWLGPMVTGVLQRPLALGDYEVITSHHHDLVVNWKVFAENARDGYHVPFVHPFFRKYSPPREYHLGDHGHAVQHLGMDFTGMEPELRDPLSRYPLPGLEVGEGYIVNVFPDLAITVRSNVVSLDFQRAHGPTQTVLENRTLGLVDDTDEMRAARARSQRAWFSDPLEEEDYPIFMVQQRGVSSRKVRSSVIARGSDATSGTRGDDNRLRHFWGEWRRLLGVAGNSLAGM
jgi:phenylpropionate dioxygenase-like ring-hydroxylating dioxygenase large terminal subunit